MPTSLRCFGPRWAEDLPFDRLQVDFSQSVAHLWKQFRRFGTQGDAAAGEAAAAHGGAPGGGGGRGAGEITQLSHSARLPHSMQLRAKTRAKVWPGSQSPMWWGQKQCSVRHLTKLAIEVGAV